MAYHGDIIAFVWTLARIQVLQYIVPSDIIVQPFGPSQHSFVTVVTLQVHATNGSNFVQRQGHILKIHDPIFERSCSTNLFGVSSECQWLDKVKTKSRHYTQLRLQCSVLYYRREYCMEIVLYHSQSWHTKDMPKAYQNRPSCNLQ